MKFITLILVLFLSSCRKEPEFKTMDFGSFAIRTPVAWNYLKESGTDSYYGKIVIDESDTVYFDLGWYSNKLEDNYKENNYKSASIDNKDAKIVSPKKHGNGVTGVYFDSLWKSGSYKDKLQISGENLKVKNQNDLLKAIKTIKFQKR